MRKLAYCSHCPGTENGILLLLRATAVITRRKRCQHPPLLCQAWSAPATSVVSTRFGGYLGQASRSAIVELILRAQTNRNMGTIRTANTMYCCHHPRYFSILTERYCCHHLNRRLPHRLRQLHDRLVLTAAEQIRVERE